MSENHTFLLDLYYEAVQCFLDLHSVFEQNQNLSTISKNQQIDICLEKIQYIIQIEDANPSLDTCDQEIIRVLPHLYMQLNHLKYQTNNPLTCKIETVGQSKEEESLKGIVDSSQVTPKIKSFNDIAGLTFVKNILTTVVLLPIKQPQLYTNKKISNSILLYGPPGTGKTHLVHALAAEASAKLYSVAPSNILSSYVGQTEKLVDKIFKTVKENQGCTTILFIDEIDGLCRRRSENEAEWNRRLKTELLCQISAIEDCVNVFLICATNCPWDLDPAFFRRFQQRIFIPLPSRPDRFDLLKLFTKNTLLEATSNYWGPLLNRTEGYSGSDLADLIRHAFNIPLTELINNKYWITIENNMYRPAIITDNPSLLIECKVQELPPRSVQARELQFSDLIAAAEAVKRTISEVDMKKFEAFEKM